MSEATQSDFEVAASLEPRKIYLKDASFESPSTPYIFGQGEIKPSIEVQMTMTHVRIDKDKNFYEVVLNTVVTAKQNDKTLFLAEVQQAGIFEIRFTDADRIAMALETACPHILLPYAREELSNLVGKGGFPQLLLNPVNFKALYDQKKAKEARSAPATDPAKPN